MSISRPLLVLLLIGVAVGAPHVSAEAPAGVDPDWMSAIRADIGDSEYRVTWQTTAAIPGLGPSWQAPNRSQGFRTYFTDRGIHVAPRTEDAPSGGWGLALVGYGRRETTWPVAVANVSPSSNRADCSRRGLGDWYLNSPRGLERGANIIPLAELEVSDASGDVPPGGIRHYNVTAYNHRCPADGPW